MFSRSEQLFLTRADHDHARGKNVAQLVGVRRSVHRVQLAARLHRCHEVDTQATTLAADLGAGRRFVRGLFSGGTLGKEALLVLRESLPTYRTNPEEEGPRALDGDDRPTDHLILDLGDDRYTRGRPHPMIDFGLRCQRLQQELADPSCAVLLLDVVLGYGAHPDPAGELATAVAGRLQPGGPVLLACVVGTENDPQPRPDQVRRLTAAGFQVLDTNVEAARMAAAILVELQRRNQP